LSDLQGRADELRTKLHRWLHEYHVLDDPSVDDATYDAMRYPSTAFLHPR